MEVAIKCEENLKEENKKGLKDKFEALFFKIRIKSQLSHQISLVFDILWWLQNIKSKY